MPVRFVILAACLLAGCSDNDQDPPIVPLRDGGVIDMQAPDQQVPDIGVDVQTDIGVDAPLPPACAAPADSDTVALYDFDGSDPFADATGNHNATMVGSTPVVSSQPGCSSALQVGDTVANYLVLPTSLNAAMPQVKSIDVWVRFVQQTQELQAILSSDASGQPAANQQFTIWRGCDGAILLRMQSGNFTYILCSDPVATGSDWHHVVVNFGAPQVELIVDDVVATRTDFAAVLPQQGGGPCQADQGWQCGAVTNLEPAWDEPIAVGVSTWGSTPGQLTPITQPMFGEIDALRFSKVRQSPAN